MRSFSIQQILTSSWKLFTENWQVVLLASGIEVVASLLGTALGNALRPNWPVAAVVVGLVFFLAQIGLSVGLVKIALEIVDGKKPQISEMWTNFSYVLPYIIMSIVMVVAVGLGFLLLILPGIYLLMRLQLAPYFLIDKNVGALASLNRSWEATKPNVWNLLGFDLVIFVVYVLVMIVFGVIGGVLAMAIPGAQYLTVVGSFLISGVVMLAMAMVYRKLASV